MGETFDTVKLVATIIQLVAGAALPQTSGVAAEVLAVVQGLAKALNAYAGGEISADRVRAELARLQAGIAATDAQIDKALGR